MRLVIQRCINGSVSINGETVGSIEQGYVVFVGVSDKDDKDIVDKMVAKLVKLRICEDADGKTNLSLQDTKGSILLISQFTLYADCKKGNRPSFVNAGSPDHAKALYTYMIDAIKNTGIPCEHGQFGADMKVSLVNDGPFTIVLDSETL